MPNIIFKASSEYFNSILLKPFPASKAIPEWWRNHSPYVKDESNPEGKKLLIRNGLSNATFKKCVPMLDSLTAGYIIPLYADVQVTQVNDSTVINWTSHQQVLDMHGKDSFDIEPPAGFSNQLFIYKSRLTPITPKGYSILITHPFGYNDLPVRAVSAIVDSDKNKTELSLPFWVKTKYQGIIEKGTPMVQVIPFKRENWSSSFDFYEKDTYLQEEDKNWRSVLMNHYIKNIWTKKEYK